jgi:hypothetical protein
MIDLPAPLNVALSDIHRPCLSIEGDLRKSNGRDLFNWGNDFEIKAESPWFPERKRKWAWLDRNAQA